MKTRRIDPGMLRTWATLQQAVSTDDGAGGLDILWVDVATVPIFLEPLGATESRHGEQDLETATHRAIFRRRDDVRSGMRFVVGARTLTIRVLADRDRGGHHQIALIEEEGR